MEDQSNFNTGVRTPFVLEHPTVTPFHPLVPTAAYGPPRAEKIKIIETPTLVDTSPVKFRDYGLNFSDQGGWMSIQIDPPNKEVNNGKIVELSFLLGKACIFGDQRACIHQYNDGNRDIVLLTIHSGVGGEAQEFRHAVEGTGINRAGYSLKKVQSNLDSITGAQVAISQDKDQSGRFSLVGITRIPPEYVQTYLDSTIYEVLDLANRLNPDLGKKLDPTLPIVAFETCGWKMVGEPWLPGITSTSGAIYLAVIQPSESR